MIKHNYNITNRKVNKIVYYQNNNNKKNKI